MIDTAMRSIEQENKRLKDILPKNFARPELDKRRLGEVVDLFTNIQMIEHGNSKGILGRTYEYCLSKFAEQEGKLADTYSAYTEGTLEDQKGFCEVVDREKIEQQDYILTPGRYVGIEEQKDDGEPFEEKMGRLTKELSELFAQSHKLEAEIRERLGRLGMKYELVELGKLCNNIVIDGTPKSTFLDYYNGGITWLNTKEVHFNRIYKTEKTISNLGLQNSTAKWIPSNCIIIAMYGATAGNVAINLIPLTTNQACCNLEIDERKADYRCIYYCLKACHMKLSSLANGGAQQNLNLKLIRNFMIALPSLQIQSDIADIVWSIDNKIELNNKINENLRQQVTEIYKSWYKDFSRAANLPLVETEFGLIPQEWRYALLGDLCKSISIAHKFDKDKLVFLNTGDIENGRFFHSNYMAVEDMPVQAKKTIAPGDILYSEIRPINRHFAYVNFPAEDYVVSTKLMVIRANGFDTRRLYHFLASKDILSELQMQAESRSGIFPQIRFDNVSKLPILIADKEIETAFIALLHTVYDQIEHNNCENEKLAALRDTLLPKLMNGEIELDGI